MLYSPYEYEPLFQWLQLNASATGTTAIGSLGPVPEGYCWLIDGASTKSNSTGNPTLEVFRMSVSGNTDNYSRVDYTASGKNNVADYSQPIYVPPGYYLTASYASLNNNDQCWFIVRGRQFPLKTQTAFRRDIGALLAEHLIVELEQRGLVRKQAGVGGGFEGTLTGKEFSGGFTQ